MATSVRKATPDDLGDLLALAAAMAAESPRYRRYQVSAEKLKHLLDMVVAQGGAFVAVDDGRVVGMIGGFVAPHFFSDDLIASDLALYLMPSHRRGLTAVRLLKSFEQWAFAAGAKDVTLGISAEIEAPRVADLYKACGYSLTGCSFVKGREDV